MSSAKLWKRARALHMLKHCLENGMEGYFDFIHKVDEPHQELIVDEAVALIDNLMHEVREDATLALEIAGGGGSDNSGSESRDARKAQAAGYTAM